MLIRNSFSSKHELRNRITNYFSLILNMFLNNWTDYLTIKTDWNFNFIRIIFINLKNLCILKISGSLLKSLNEDPWVKIFDDKMSSLI